MNTDMIFQTSSDSLEKTEQLAANLGRNLRGGEVIVLTSDLGGGKTAFVRGLAKGMGSSDHVASPTFTIGRQYSAVAAGTTRTLYHFDFYRLQEPGIMSLELQEAQQDMSAVLAIEWGDIVESILPASRILVRIAPTGDMSRAFTFEYPQTLQYLFQKVAET